MQKNTKNAKNAKKKWKKPKFLLLSLSSSLLSSSSTSSTSSSSSRSFSMQNLVSWKLTELWPIWFRSKKGRHSHTHWFHRYIVVRYAQLIIPSKLFCSNFESLDNITCTKHSKSFIVATATNSACMVYSEHGKNSLVQKSDVEPHKDTDLDI